MKCPLALLAGVLLLTGCNTLSIPDSDYRESPAWGRPDNPAYKGELTELDILGVTKHEEAAAANIAKILDAAVTPRPKRGDRLILIQSGALTPDNAMAEEASRYFEVAPFSGSRVSRATNDQKLVSALKEKGYGNLVAELVK